MDTTTAIRLAILILIFSLIFYGVFSFVRSIKRANAKRRKEYEAYQHGLDNQLRAAGHSEEYVGKERQIRTLKAKRRDAKIGYYAAWIGGIICLFVFPPIGVFLTGFAIIMTVREGGKLRKEMHDTAYEIKAVRDSMPEK
jgi:NADH:ubiquinone oxidoreductase subunit 3 (subunit A)